MNYDKFLEDILIHKRQLNDERRPYFSALVEKVKKIQFTRYSLFKKRISQAGKMNLIAEIKKASPSKGLIRSEFDVSKIAEAYSDSGADAVSILTEEKYFLGNPAYIRKVSADFAMPILAKDFFIDEGQIYEAHFNGASAILLIMAILENEKVEEFIQLAAHLDLDCLVEIHDEQELKRALDCGAEIIGINNRDLRTFEVDLKNCERLIPQIPKDKVIVAESGIRTHQDVKFLEDLGAHAVLIGETFMKEDDIGQKVKEVMNG